MKKVVLSGYYGFDNIGDEAVLYSIITALRELMPDIEITVLSNNPNKTSRLYDVLAVDRWKITDVRQVIKECDLVISGGGSLLQDVTGMKSVLYYLGVMKLALWAKKPLFVYSQGIGPLKSAISQSLCASVLKKATAITVRDEQSKKDLVSYGISAKNILVTADPVLSMVVDKVNGGAKKIAISVRPWNNLPKEDFAWVADYLIKDGYSVSFVPFHYPGDLELSREIMSMMTHKCDCLEVNMTPMEMLEYLANFDLLIGMRLHSLIMSASLSIPFIAVSYDPKINAFTDRTGLPVIADLSDYDSVDFKHGVMEFIANQNKYKGIMVNNISALREKAKESAKRVYDILMAQE